MTKGCNPRFLVRKCNGMASPVRGVLHFFVLVIFIGTTLCNVLVLILILISLSASCCYTITRLPVKTALSRVPSRPALATWPRSKRAPSWTQPERDAKCRQSPGKGLGQPHRNYQGPIELQVIKGLTRDYQALSWSILAHLGEALWTVGIGSNLTPGLSIQACHYLFVLL